MSLQLINHSPDLKRLRDQGYNLEIRSGYLLLKDVPYVNAAKQVKLGTIVSKLEMANDTSTPPGDHTVYFAGEYPCMADGAAIEQIRNTTATVELDRDFRVDHRFSAKPQPSGKYEDYYAKMTTYAAILSGPARVIDPSVTAQTYPMIEAKAEESVFKYVDTASSRVEITAVTRKLELSKVAIIGLGGTGSYVLDLLAKTPIKEIHTYDGDSFLQHNAFRSPGAPSGEELGLRLPKVTYFERIYSKMHRGIISHHAYVDASNVEQLRGMVFVFLCLDRGGAKKFIIEKLEEFGIPFVDVGMGVYLSENGSLGGVLRVTTSTSEKREHVRANDRIPLHDGNGNNEYDQNIQIADLNALNAAMAVVKWKKLFGFYQDLDREHHSTYTIDGNHLNNTDKT
jgi:hypothetical protein